ncbi:hypothetical protein E6C60_1667 [Paenibacillus algicola]|uniref:Uncharacterized protein n=1 Tax=Paenibacillus algicola TaxID=2565926 RepID=A0A4P8XIF6_9BACL|nr:hypothetical protein E6C60_1667 [Paenibacillus algicola]
MAVGQKNNTLLTFTHVLIPSLPSDSYVKDQRFAGILPAFVCVLEDRLIYYTPNIRSLFKW